MKYASKKYASPNKRNNNIKDKNNNNTIINIISEHNKLSQEKTRHNWMGKVI